MGGVANAINMDNMATLNMKKLAQVQVLLNEVQSFIKNVYLPDVIAIGSMYPEWLGYGAGVTNYMSVPDLPLDEAGTEFDLPGGTIMNADLGSFKPISSFNDEYFRDNVEEGISHSWYDGDWQRHPWEEETVPKYTEWEDDGDYSWVKSPRFQDEPMQVGPLAQVLAGLASGHELFTKYWCLRAGRSRQARRRQADPEGLAFDPRSARGAVHSVRRAVGPRPEALGSAGQQHRQRGRRRSGGSPNSRACREGSASTKLRAARCHTGSSLATALSRTTSA